MPRCGLVSGVGNESADDIALMNKLAYWCNADPDAMIRAFLSSPYVATPIGVFAVFNVYSTLVRFFVLHMKSMRRRSRRPVAIPASLQS